MSDQSPRLMTFDEAFTTMWAPAVRRLRYSGVPDAENVAADAFLRIYRTRPQSITRSYVWTMLRWASRDDHKKRSNTLHPPEQQLDKPDDDIAAYGYEPFAGVDEMLDVRAVWPKLSRKQQDCISRHADGYGDANDTNKSARQDGQRLLRKLTATVGLAAVLMVATAGVVQ